MTYPRYPKYRESGVEWLGDVPEGWGVKKIGFCCDFYAGQSFQTPHLLNFK